MEDREGKLLNTRIQWFPGHMAKTRRMMEENIRLVDAIIELVDARAPISSKNPYLDELWSRRPRVICLSKADLADETVTPAFEAYYRQKGFGVAVIDSVHKKGLKTAFTEAERLCREKIERQKERGMQGKALRFMITGIPNVGKSTMINQIAGRSEAAKTGNKPGVTRAKQWIRVSDHALLLDTPGILWSKFEDPLVGERLSLIGSIKEEITDSYLLACRLLSFLSARYRKLLSARYSLSEEESSLQEDALMEVISRKRGHLKAGGAVHVERTAEMLLEEFRSGKIGRVTLDEVPSHE